MTAVFSLEIPLPLRRIVIAVLVILVACVLPSTAQDEGASPVQGSIVVDDFQDDEPGTFPGGWVFVKSKEKVLSYEETKNPGETVVVKEEAGNHFLRLITKGQAIRYTKRNGVDFDWSLKEHPRLKWRWRALTLPEGASERGKNDTGGAIYVTFGTDWLGRPKSIKYTYSSSLPIGTVVDFGSLYVIVVGSAQEPGLGEWKTVQRNIMNDYRQIFGDRPPNRPVSITIWSDSDTTGGEAKVDIDDIMFLPPR